MPAPRFRYTLVEVVDRGRGKYQSHELGADDDPMVSLLLAVLAERRRRKLQAEAPPPYSGGDLDFEMPDRLAWPWQR